MGTRTSHAPGTFSWADLGTTDNDAAKAFYGSLLGWEPKDMPAGEGMIYTLQTIGGKPVAATYTMQQSEQPAAWLSYVTVEDVVATAARAEELGANLIAEPFDVMEVGRMAVIADPEGAVFAAWEPKGSIGAERVNEPGCLTWNDLGSRDPEKAAEFYGALFGWTTMVPPGAEGQYTVFMNGERSNGGVRPLQPMEPMPYWSVYFVAVGDLDDALAKVEELGGRGLTEVLSVGPGRFAAAMDPQGAVFNLYEGELDD